jgi:formylglycine-generating enzyme required for sulfatase activity
VLAASVRPGAPIIPAAPTVTIAAAPVVATAAVNNFADSFTGMEFVPVPGGCFQMGDTFGDGKSDELPVHEVCLSPFAIGKYEVTQGQWQKVMGKNPSRFQKGDNFPVENVSWEDAQDFIARLNRKSGRPYRLPTEAEWEYAARSGGKKERYAGGDQVEEVGWYERNSGFSTRAVGTQAANGLGIHDMSGNVWEWCADWRDSSYYASSPRENPPGPASGPYHSVRGGCWDDTPFLLRASNRFRGTPKGTRGGNVPGGYYIYQIFGFRLVLPQGK